MKNLLFFLLLPITIFTQNLIPNPSFEEIRNQPIPANPINNFEFESQSGFKGFNGHLNFWFSANRNTPDLRVLSPGYLDNCKKKYKNCDEAHTGTHAVGLITFMQNEETDSYREYLQIKLKEPLVPGVKTHVEFWIARERQAKLASNNIGCYFSMKKIFADIQTPILITPHINDTVVLNQNEQKWTKMKGFFVPDKAYEFLTIGNFYNNEKTKIREVKDYKGSPFIVPAAYYLFDDFNVWQYKEEPKPIKIVYNEPIRLDNILFETNSAILNEYAKQELLRMIPLLQKGTIEHIAIHGHTDNVGNDNKNLILSENRAKTIYDFLVENGMDSALLSYKGFGKMQPIDSNETGEGRRRNRRVEMILKNVKVNTQ